MQHNCKANSEVHCFPLLYDACVGAKRRLLAKCLGPNKRAKRSRLKGTHEDDSVATNMLTTIGTQAINQVKTACPSFNCGWQHLYPKYIALLGGAYHCWQILRLGCETQT